MRPFVYDSDYTKIFDQRADLYQRAMLNFPNARDEEFTLAVELADLKSNHLVLDFPSGGGYLSRYIPIDTRLYHIETSMVFANLGKRVSNHPFLFADAGHFPVENESADRLISIAGLHHIEHKNALFKEIHRVLKPGGIAVLADAQEGNETATFLDTYVDANNDLGHQGFYFNSQTAAQLEKCGFEITHDRLCTYTWNFSNESDIGPYCRDLFGLNIKQPSRIIEGVKSFLNIESDRVGSKMQWSLRYLQISKPL